MRHPFLAAIAILGFLAPQTAWSQQTATVRGKVVLPENATTDNISVTLKGTQIGTATDARGFYEIKNIKAGTYVLRVTAVGLSSKEKSITLKAGDEIVENFSIAATSEELKEVVISASKINPFSRKESTQVSRLSLKNLENPQVYTTITAELLKEQVVTNLDDALKNAAGLSQLWVATGRGGDGAGYFSLRGFAVQPTMVNGLPGITNSTFDVSNIERIEVIKGPSGTLFGSSLISYGGLININTKKPYDTFGGELSYTSGSYGLNRLTADINTPLNDAKTLNFRLNTAYQTENSFQDAGFSKSLSFAPSLAFKANDKLSFLLTSEISSSESTNPTMLFFDRGAPLRVTSPDELGYNNKRSYTSDELSIENPSFRLQGQMNYKISDSWTSQTVLSRGSAKSKGYYSYLYETSQYFPGLSEGVVLGRYFSYQNSATVTTDIQQNFIGDFKLGNFRNRVVAGLDYFNRNVTDNGTGYVGNGSIYIGKASLQNVNENVFFITDPADYITDGDSGILSKAGSDALLAGTPVNNSKTKQEVYSAYVSDVFNFTPAFSAMASIRMDRFMNQGEIASDSDDFNQTAFSPKFGLVYQPVLDKVSLFANYMNGFTNTSPASDILADGSRLSRTFGPEHANQLEFGTKLNLLKDRLSAVVSYYNIEVTDAVYTIYTATTQTSFQDGAQKNKGIEAELAANPVNGLNITLGYSYNDSVLTAGDPDFVGHRPESAGPQNTANLWVSYKLTSGKYKGLGLGLGGNYASENKIMNRATAGTFEIPSYTMLNSSLFYNTDDFSLQLKVNNITNKEAYDGWSTIHPKAPRSVSAGFAYKF